MQQFQARIAQWSIVAFMFTGCTLTGCTSLDRTVVPAPGPVPVLHAPQITAHVLENGLKVLLVQKRDLPLLSARVVIRSGSAADPEQSSGLAGFMAELLKYGTATMSAVQVADEVETLGSHIGVGVDKESITLSATALSTNFPAIFDVMADLLLKPAFAPEEVERVRRQRLGALAQVREDPRGMARRAYLRSIYGAHPYGHTVLGSADGLKMITRDQILSFYTQHIRPDNAAVILVGDIDMTTALDAVKDRFSGWTGSGESFVVPEPKQAKTGIVLVNKAGAPQSQLRLGHLGVKRDDPDYFAIVMCNAILGGLFNSRINMNLREDKGYTYGARSSFSFMRGRGPFTVNTGVRTDATGPAIVEVLKEIALLREKGVTPEELDLAKNSYSLSLPGYFQSIGTIGSMAANIFLYDLPLSYYQDLPAALAKVSVEDVKRVANAHLHPDQLAIVVVGDEEAIEKSLMALGRGPIQRRDADGKVLKVKPPN